MANSSAAWWIPIDGRLMASRRSSNATSLVWPAEHVEPVSTGMSALYPYMPRFDRSRPSGQPLAVIRPPGARAIARDDREDRRVVAPSAARRRGSRRRRSDRCRSPAGRPARVRRRRHQWSARRARGRRVSADVRYAALDGAGDHGGRPGVRVPLARRRGRRRARRASGGAGSRARWRRRRRRVRSGVTPFVLAAPPRIAPARRGDGLSGCNGTRCRDGRRCRDHTLPGPRSSLALRV